MQSYVEIEGLEVEAKHGCFDFEKTTPQKFVFDCRFWGDFSLAMSSDSLNYALNYGEAAEIIADVATKNSFNLIERTWLILHLFAAVPYISGLAAVWEIRRHISILL